ncbi:MAG: hypothetical protein D6835_01625 [Candidatus Thermofonsia bacterium]|nr:MAG: hypothetical protein D6835_01625 [Candidatus Thermofonsia bacterium]
MNWLLVLFGGLALLYVVTWLVVRRRAKSAVPETAVTPTPDNPFILQTPESDCGLCDAKWDKIVGDAR